MGESRAGAPGAEGVIITGTYGEGLGAASFQDFPRESRTQKPSESLERCLLQPGHRDGPHLHVPQT